MGGEFGLPGFGPGFYPPGLAGGGGGGGDVVGPGSSTRYAVALFDNTTGDLLAEVASLGSAGQVLTSNGAGMAPTYQNAAGGGFANWKTVGTGGDYADIQAMLDDSQYYGFLISAVTEDSNITPDANGLYLNLNGFTLTAEANQIIPSAACTITIVGLGYQSGSGSEIDYTQTVTNKPFVDTTTSGATTRITLDNFVFDNNTSAVDNAALVSSDALVNVSRIRFEGTNNAAAAAGSHGLILNSASSYATDLVFVSPGTSARNACFINAGKADNIIFTGTWNAAGVNNLVLGSSVNVSNVTSTGSLGVEVGSSAVLSDFNATGGTIVMLCANDNRMNGIWLTGTSNIDFQNADNIVLGSFYTGTLDMSDSSNSNCTVSNGYVDDAFTMGGDAIILNNIRFNSTFAVSAGSDNHVCNGLWWDGNVSITSDNSRYSGYVNTANTFTLNATAANNTVDVTIDQTVVDNSGVGTNAINENVY